MDRLPLSSKSSLSTLRTGIEIGEDRGGSRGPANTGVNWDSSSLMVATYCIKGIISVRLDELALKSPACLKKFHLDNLAQKSAIYGEDCTESASQKVKNVLLRRRKWPFSSSENCYFWRNICGSFLGPHLAIQYRLCSTVLAGPASCIK